MTVNTPLSDDEVRARIAKMSELDRLVLIEQLRQSPHPTSLVAYQMLVNAYREEFGTWPRRVTVN